MIGVGLFALNLAGNQSSQQAGIKPGGAPEAGIKPGGAPSNDDFGVAGIKPGG